MSGANGSLHGLNLYVYCFNNPINMTDSQGNWTKWVEDAWEMAESVMKEVLRTATKISDIVFTREFAEEFISSAITNFEADAGVSIGFAFEKSFNDMLSFEFSQRMDILSVGVKDGKFKLGHDGRSALAVGVLGFTLGPQTDTYEDLNGVADTPTQKYIDFGNSYCESLVVILGGHINVSFSMLGFSQNIYNYIKGRW